MVLPEGPGISFPYVVHEPDVALPDEEGDKGKEGVAGDQFGVSVEPVGDDAGEVGDQEPQCRYADQPDHPVVESIFIVHSSWVRAMAPVETKIVYGNDALRCVVRYV